MELEMLFPRILFSGHLKRQIDPRELSELGLGPVEVEGQGGIPHWTATIKEKMVRARENNLNIVGKGDLGSQRNQARVPRG